MNEYTPLIQQLKQKQAKSDGVSRLEYEGLSMRLYKHTSGLWELIAWRANVAPSLHEIGNIIAAIRNIDDPQLVTRSEPEQSHDGKHHAYRLWWWAVPVTVSWHQPVQRELIPASTEPCTQWKTRALIT